jgi:hypothetical protein
MKGIQAQIRVEASLYREGEIVYRRKHFGGGGSLLWFLLYLALQPVPVLLVL